MPLTKLLKEKFYLFLASFCIINKNLSVKSKLQSVILPSLLLNIESLSLSAPIWDTLDWPISTERGVVKAFPQERPAGKHTAGPEWEVYFAWCMNILGMWGSLHRGLKEHRGVHHCSTLISPSSSFTV